MLFSDLGSIPMVKKCDWGLEYAALISCFQFSSKSRINLA